MTKNATKSRPAAPASSCDRRTRGDHAGLTGVLLGLHACLGVRAVMMMMLAVSRAHLSYAPSMVLLRWPANAGAGAGVTVWASVYHSEHAVDDLLVREYHHGALRHRHAPVRRGLQHGTRVQLRPIVTVPHQRLLRRTHGLVQELQCPAGDRGRAAVVVQHLRSRTVAHGGAHGIPAQVSSVMSAAGGVTGSSCESRKGYGRNKPRGQCMYVFTTATTFSRWPSRCQTPAYSSSWSRRNTPCTLVTTCSIPAMYTITI
jgi:surface antigen